MEEPSGARKTLLIETNSHAVKRLKSESAAGKCKCRRLEEEEEEEEEIYAC
jgi:hypothetical protein